MSDEDEPTVLDAWCDCTEGAHPGHWWHPWSSTSCTNEDPVTRGGVVPVTPHYSAALDEIFELRTLLAHEAAIREADLELKSFPKSRRWFAEQSVKRMRSAARGELDLYAVSDSRTRNDVRAQAGMPNTMTRAEWERQTFTPDPVPRRQS